MLMRQDAEGYRAACEALADAPPTDVAPIKCPTLLLTGDEDPIATATGMRAIAPGCWVAHPRGRQCGHWATFGAAERDGIGAGGGSSWNGIE